MSTSLTPEEAAAKAQRVRALLDEHGLDSVVLRSPGGCAWWSGGGRTHVVATPEVGVADLVLTRDGDGVATTVVTWANEAPRLQAEELAGLEQYGEVRWQVLPWTQPRETVLPTGPRVGRDVPLPECVDVAAELVRLRASLVPAEVERLRELGRDAAEAVTSACGTLAPTGTEWSAAAAAGAALLERGIDPVVLLVAGAERLAVHRHPLPTAERLGEVAMVVVCGRRHGLVVSLTRLLGRPEGDVLDRLLHVDATVNLATRPGRRVGQVFQELQAAYVQHGFAPDEWTRHHQGGPAGYAPRDLVADPDTPDLVAPWQCFAWNPTGPGVKSEDTVLATDAGPEVVTVDPAWPARDVDGLRRPLPLAWP